MPSFTPGPWIVDGEDFSAKVLAPDGYVIAETQHVHGGKTLGDCEEIHLKNMRLIAAAPDLLTALKRFVAVNNRDGYEFDSNEPELYAEIEAAIAKATGGS